MNRRKRGMEKAHKHKSQRIREKKKGKK